MCHREADSLAGLSRDGLTALGYAQGRTILIPGSTTQRALKMPRQVHRVARLDAVEMLNGLIQGADRDFVKIWPKGQL